jgi:hypothetical protein
MGNEKHLIGRIEFSEKLPDNWKPLYESYKTDSVIYMTALLKIREVLQNEEDCHECADRIESIITEVLEG